MLGIALTYLLASPPPMQGNDAQNISVPKFFNWTNLLPTWNKTIVFQETGVKIWSTISSNCSTVKVVDVIQSVSSPGIFAPTCWRFIRHIRVHVLYDVISDSSTMETRTTHVVVIINYYFLWYHENVLVLGRTQVAGRSSASHHPAPVRRILVGAVCHGPRLLPHAWIGDLFFGLLGSETPVESATAAGVNDDK